MIDNLNYIEVHNISLKDCSRPSFLWLEELIIKNPTILGLSEVKVHISFDRKGNGKCSAMLLRDTNDESKIRYAVEAQFGSLDELQLTRAIEFWGERSRSNPELSHSCVLVAEEFSQRFFKIISYLRKSIPIILIQLKAIQIENHYTLIFTRLYDEVEN